MSQTPNQTVQEAVDLAIRDHGELGIQVAAYLDGKLVVDIWDGIADVTTGRKVEPDTLFHVFSVTKAMAAVALHIQVDRGLVDYEAPVAKYWPEFGKHGKEKITIYDILTHRVGIPQMPVGVAPELMCDWDWMIGQIVEMRPLFEPGTRCVIMGYIFGWIICEVVERTDPKGRMFQEFFQEEICLPLGIDNLWIGIPDEAESRVAKLIDAPSLPPGASGMAPDSIYRLSIPPQVGTRQEILGRLDVMRACIPGVNGLMNARSAARFWGMLANGGELDGVRLLSEERVRLFSVPLQPFDYDPVIGVPHRGSLGAFWLVGGRGMAAAGSNLRTFGHAGFGGTLGWADPDTRLGAVMLHNRMFPVPTYEWQLNDEENHFKPIGQAIRRSLGLAE